MSIAVPAMTAKTVVAEIVEAWAETSIALLDLRDSGPFALTTILFAEESREAAVNLRADPAVNSEDDVLEKDKEDEEIDVVSVDDAEMDLAELRATVPELLRASNPVAETSMLWPSISPLLPLMLKELPLIVTTPSDETRVDIPLEIVAEYDADTLTSWAMAVILLSLDRRTAVSPIIDAISSVLNVTPVDP
jgi:hypothetical protein